MTPSKDAVMTESERLVEVAAITRVKTTYANAADLHDWERFASVFTVDASFDESDFPDPVVPYSQDPASDDLITYLRSFSSGGVEWPLIGRQAILDQHLPVSPDHQMVHQLFNPDIELTSDTTADAMFRFESHHWFPPGGAIAYMHNFGAYHETYVKLDDGRWYIRSLRLERRRVECRQST